MAQKGNTAQKSQPFFFLAKASIISAQGKGMRVADEGECMQLQLHWSQSKL